MRFILCLLFLAPLSFSQDAFNWQNYSNQKEINSIALSDDGVWAATTGGAFHYDYKDSSFLYFHKEEGLSSSSLTSSAIDSEGKIWLGSSNGIIDVFSKEKENVKNILDIFSSDKSNKHIYELKAYGDTIIASTDFGFSLIDSKTFIFYDTFFKFSSLPSNTKVNSVLKSGLIYVSTNLGLAAQKAGASNLSAPESWQLYTTASGLPSNLVNKAEEFKGKIIAATSAGLAEFSGGNWNRILPQISNVKDIFSQGDSLFILWNNTVSIYNGTVLSDIYTSSVELKNIQPSSFSLVLASTKNGILNIGSGSAEFIVPNSPNANQFPDLSVDKNGNLWSASGRDVTGAGFYKLDENVWTNYTSSNSNLPNNAYHSVFSSPDGKTYIGNWGAGFAKIDGDSIKVFNTANTPFQGITGAPDFLVITDFASDSKNNLWVLNFGGANRVNLAALTPDNTWYGFTNPSEGTLALNEHYYLSIDLFNTKWYAIRDARKAGLFYFNEGSFSDQNDDKSGVLTSSSGLNSNSITSVTVDKRGDVWVGTNLGANIISNTNAAINTNTSFRISSVFTLRQQTINTIAVDPLNQKWVGTNQGLLLLSSDGSRLISVYDSKNSALPSDEIKSIAIDEKLGRIYVGTSSGLTSFDTQFKKPNENFDNLVVYPSPYILNSDNGSITIDGLIKDSDIKILSVSGKLVYQFSSPGGRTASWNGRDEFGNFVSSGVYIVVAFDKEGNSVASQKIAIVRE